jgi:hypothetical protein
MEFWLSLTSKYFVFRLLARNVKIKIQSVILRLVLDGRETWYLTMRKGYELKVTEYRVLRKISGPNREVGKYFIIYTTHKILLGLSCQGG